MQTLWKQYHFLFVAKHIFETAGQVHDSTMSLQLHKHTMQPQAKSTTELNQLLQATEPP